MVTLFVIVIPFAPSSSALNVSDTLSYETFAFAPATSFTFASTLALVASLVGRPTLFLAIVCVIFATSDTGLRCRVDDDAPPAVFVVLATVVEPDDDAPP